MARSAPARLLEEYYKILRSGHAAEAFRQLRTTGLLKVITPELAAASDGLWDAIAALDRYRARFEAIPDTLTNPILAGTLLHPLGLAGRRQRFSADPLERRLEIGLLTMPRRDVERLQQILTLQPRLLDTHASARAQRALLHRPAFQEALTWLEIHGDRPSVVEHWRFLQAESVPGQHPVTEVHPTGPFRRRRRRRRRTGAPHAAPQE
jgi:poly(A) polymerase